jgi:hypothetical protein
VWVEHTAKFIPGLRLSGLYYKNVVAVILRRKFPKLRYSAGLLGAGSEVLGYDTERSMNHNWGLRLFIFLSEDDLRTYGHQIDEELTKNLPQRYLGYPTSFGKPNVKGVRLPDFRTKRDDHIEHYVKLLTIGRFLRYYLGVRDYKRIEPMTWLGMSQQRLLEVTRGRIFHDGLQIKAIIRMFRYYPRDIWLYLMASQWQKISEEEAFIARTSEIGDELGSRIIATRISEELMGLCFLMERRYAPYSKWFGKAFSELGIARKLTPVLSSVINSTSIDEREANLSRAYSIVARKHNSLHITKPISNRVSRFHDRPFKVIHGERFAKEIRKGILNEEISKLPLAR